MFSSKMTTFSSMFLLFVLYLSGVSSLGINYGQVANNLPPPDKVLELMNAIKLTKARIYDTNPQILTAFANSNVELVVTIENQMLPVVVDPQQALQWVNTHIKPYFPATKITGIAVGNEIFSDDDSSLVRSLVPAIISIHGALVQLGLDRYIKVSTPNSLAVLAQSYPPSAGSFKPEVNQFMPEFLKFLSETNSPFWINAYPYFAYKDNPTKIPIDYVLFNRNQGMVDPYTKLHYDNMLYAQVDAVIFAMARMGYGHVEVRVSETGWPSKGDGNEIGATPQNAAVYNHNLLKRQLSNEGTPLRPNYRLEVYIFALFNEDLKPGPTSERNYGLFQPDMTMAYNVGLNNLGTPSSTTTTSSSSSTSTFPSTTSLSPTSPSSASSFTITLPSSATKGVAMKYQTLLCLMLVCLLTFQDFTRRGSYKICEWDRDYVDISTGKKY